MLHWILSRGESIATERICGAKNFNICLLPALRCSRRRRRASNGVLETVRRSNRLRHGGTGRVCPVSGIDMQFTNPSVRPQNDRYTYINGEVAAGAGSIVHTSRVVERSGLIISW